MFRTRQFVLCSLLASMVVLTFASSVEAGPLLDWLRQRRCFRQQRRQQTTCCPQPATTCTQTCMKTCSRTVVNYVACTAYRTSWDRIPVTQYRPVTSSDPCTGCTVTCMKPCTTYTWRMKQVPYTTYRPVYRQETYRVPVTYTTQIPSPCGSCSTCPTSSCSTCAAPGAAPMATTNPGCPSCSVPTATPAPAGTMAPSGSYYQNTPTPATVPPTGTPTPADTRPSLSPQSESTSWYAPPLGSQPSARPQATVQPTAQPWPGGNVTPIRDPDPQPFPPSNAAPQLLNPLDQTASAETIERWNYSPVRLASHRIETPVAAPEPITYEGRLERVQPAAPARQVNQGWRSGSW